MKLTNFLADINPLIRILLIIGLTVAAHFTVKLIRRFSRYLLTMKLDPKETAELNLPRRYPRITTIITLLINAVTFTIYFVAVGMILHEFKISLTTYFASATVIGLAVGFGLQGFVQDLVIGLTLIFSDALNIGEVVKLGDEIGRIDIIGLRFTALINLHGQRILIPNRNIAVISQFRGGCIRAYVDIQLPQRLNEKNISQAVHAIANAMYQQHKSIILTPPELFGIKEVSDAQWRYLRIKFKLWPGQIKIIEDTFKERVVQLLKTTSEDYAPWMITVTYKVE
ncbi:mechanosensitive ion channel domain-containing protein [Desulfobacula sp.]|uniref:mechanosensitive ion channel family protein n=1 Tax=Desulfobacula sp. TaxID=2593537 RepID=UPI00263312D0|nr:mechanosensitive ion channel domain-containing protein [Desulfobacula sp.]